MDEARPTGLCADCELLDAIPDKLADRKQLAGVPFRDMKHLDEAKRIEEIVLLLQRNRGEVLGVMVDCNGDYADKGDRWVEEIKRQLPAVTVLLRKKNSPIKDVELIKLRLAFTLSELLTTIAIIAVLAGLLLPALASAKSKMRQMKCMNNHHQLTIALQCFVDDHGVYPTYDIPEWTRETDWDAQLQCNRESFNCPAVGLTTETNWNWIPDVPDRDPMPNQSTGYNVEGTAVPSTPGCFGLNGRKEVLNTIVAFADYRAGIEKAPGVLFPQFLYSWTVTAPHNGRVVLSFTDGHAQAQRWIDATNNITQWNAR